MGTEKGLDGGRGDQRVVEGGDRAGCGMGITMEKTDGLGRTDGALQ